MKKHFDAVDVFTTPTRFMVDHFAKWGLDPNRIIVVGNGQADYSGGRPFLDERRNRNRFGFFGQLVDNKGVHVILEAVDLLRGSGFTDFVVEINGDNLRYASEPRRKAFEVFMAQEAERRPEEQNVVMNGSYHVDQLASRMSRVDWCIVPSVWWEIFGLVISEAWMFRRPVIASNVGGMKERIRHEVDGLHFNVGDARSLAETMRRACREDGLWDRLVDGIRPPSSREEMSERFLDLYESVDLPVAASA
jgi:glycosyltransferase involved in cell wall biosynthesis